MTQSLWAADKLRIIVTSECNLSCFYCHNEGQEKGTIYMQSPMIEQIQRLLGRSSTLPKSITFSGGEPLLHPQLSEFLDTLRPLGVPQTVVTNAHLLDLAKLEELRLAGVTKFRIGVDSLSRRKSRPSPGPQDGRPIIDTIEYVLASGVALELNVVLTGYNRNEIPEIISFAVTRRISVKFFEHVDVAAFGSDVSTAEMKPAEMVPFTDFHNAVLQSFPSARHAACPDFGVANYCYDIDGIEIRYCRYLCPFHLCYLTGTRVDAEGYVYVCMSGRGAHRIKPDQDPITSSAIILRAIRAGCGADIGMLPIVNL
jgi:GTP 3',8-cyclase